MSIEQRLNQEVQVYRLGDGLSFTPTSKHPTGVLIGVFYHEGAQIGRGCLTVNGDQYDAILGCH